ncbi:cysteine proteinase [Poronia punctata]|nr:cysteine proteinase [Poronia punctata]
MKTNSIPKKFLGRRDKLSHRRDRSSEGTQKHRPTASDHWIFSLFKSDAARQTKEEDEATRQEREAAKVEDVRQRIASLNIDLPGLRDEYIRYALNSRYSSMDVDRAIEILTMQEDAIQGNIVAYDPAVHMLGAENRGNVTCYLDALLFAMFAKLDAFECMLEADLDDDEPRSRLAVLLRLWVNMLRSGKLIDTEMTEQLQAALADCGWKEAQYLEQQDTSEAFAFITDKLQLPLLTLQADLFHHGKNDDADHKVVYERLLNLAVPADVEGKGIKLEDCLEEYFNSRVDVLREGSDEKRAMDRFDVPLTPNGSNELKESDGPSTPKSTIRIVSEEVEDLTPSTSLPDGHHDIVRQSKPDFNANETGRDPESLRRPQRSRTDSIIRRVVLDKREKPSDVDTAGLFQRAKRRASAVKAVTIPAWQFFKLIPWHSSESIEPQSDSEVARHFNQRPVVGICLKRYMMDNYGNMKRQNTYIDIPESLRLPHFIIDDRHVEEDGLNTEYKLELQSVVCHRGDSLHSGHYVAFSRIAPKLLTYNRRHATDPPPDYEEAQWAKFDDLAPERVVLVEDIKEALKEEMPYLLFYQIVPLVATASALGGAEPSPPAYVDRAPVVVKTDSVGNESFETVSRKTSSYFGTSSGIPSAAPSVRFSVDVERPTRPSFTDDEGFLATSRRASIAYGDMTPINSDRKSNGHALNAGLGEETTAQRLSRAAAMFKPTSRSRPHSQAGETRIGHTMSKLGLRKSSREPLRDAAQGTQGHEDELAAVNGFSEVEELEQSPHENSKAKESDVSHRKGKSKPRFGMGKPKDAEEPERVCAMQ